MKIIILFIIYVIIIIGFMIFVGVLLSNATDRKDAFCKKLGYDKMIELPEAHCIKYNTINRKTGEERYYITKNEYEAIIKNEI